MRSSSSIVMDMIIHEIHPTCLRYLQTLGTPTCAFMFDLIGGEGGREQSSVMAELSSGTRSNGFSYLACICIPWCFGCFAAPPQGHVWCVHAHPAVWLLLRAGWGRARCERVLSPRIGSLFQPVHLRPLLQPGERRGCHLEGGCGGWRSTLQTLTTLSLEFICRHDDLKLICDGLNCVGGATFATISCEEILEVSILSSFHLVSRTTTMIHLCAVF